MQRDGNLVLYAGRKLNKVVWASHTNGHPGSHLVVQYSGNVVIRSRLGKVIWQTHT